MLTREVQITWKGETVSFVPSMQVMSNFERSGTSVMHVVMERMAGRTPTFLMAGLVGHMLRAAKVNVSDEEVLREIHGGDAMAVHDVVDALILALYPELSGKKDEAPEENEEKG